jgi:hypothetical protein
VTLRRNHSVRGGRPRLPRDAVSDTKQTADEDVRRPLNVVM